MERNLAGWNPFKRSKPGAKAPGVKVQRAESAQAPVALPPTREAQRRTPDRGLPRFNTTASDQISGRGDALQAKRAKLRHAFTPSQPIGDRRMFAGREATLRTVISAIEDQRLHLVLYGDRGIGKTSLLHMLAQAATEARYIVIYTSCGADADFDDTFRSAAAEIPVRFHSGFAPTAEQAEQGSTLFDLLPEERLSPRQFADMCARLTGTRVLIVLDEFDRCENPEFRRDVAELIKNLSDRLGRVQLVLAGVAADLTQLVLHIPSIRRNIFALRVPKMSDAEALQIVSNGERESDLNFDNGARELIVAVSRGSPYLTNLLCFHASQTALLDGRDSVKAADVADAIENAHAEFESRLSKSVRAKLRRLKTADHQANLKAAARTALSVDGPFDLSEFSEINQTERPAAARVVETLVAEGLLVSAESEDGDERFEFIEEILPTYLWISAARVEMAVREERVPAARA